ncbi:MAG: hypothetical protein KDB27_03220, partial [Planctomycetales bacterium]|nr:hypothetical protein [Planctomycetales bacterium]
IVIYKLLTGTTPLQLESIEGKTLTEILETIATVDPERPSIRIRGMDASSKTDLLKKLSTDATMHNHVLRQDLDWLVLKAISSDPADRYASAAELAEDIRRYLDHEPISAAAGSYLYHIRTFYRRNRVACLASAVVAVATFSSFSMYSHFEGRHRVAQETLRAEFAAIIDEVEAIYDSRPERVAGTLESWHRIQEQINVAAELARQLPPSDPSQTRLNTISGRTADSGHVFEELEQRRSAVHQETYFDAGTLSLHDGQVHASRYTDDWKSAESETVPLMFRPLVVETLTLQLANAPRGLGVHVARDKHGLYVNSVHPNGAASLDQRIRPGTRLIDLPSHSAELGIPVAHLTPSHASILLNGTPRTTHELVLLNPRKPNERFHVSLVTDDKQCLELLDSLDRLDSDSWRTKLRQAIRQYDARTLRDLAVDPSLDDQPLHSFVLLAATLRDLAFDQEKLRVLRKAQRQFAQDPLANQVLAESLALECKPAQLDEAARHLTATIAIDSNRPVAQFLLARILHEQGKMEEAEDRYKHVIAHGPKSVTPRAYYISLLHSQGRQKEADAELKEIQIEHGYGKNVQDIVRNVYLQQQHRISDSEMIDRSTLRFLNDSATGKIDSQLPANVKQKLERLQKVLGR